MPRKRIISTILFVVVLLGGMVAGILLLQERQELRKLAAVPDGEATVSILPETGNFDIGDTIPVSVYFNTANIPISGIAVLLSYPYSDVTPEVSVSDIQVNPSLLSTGNWSCPTSSHSESAGVVKIEIACANISATGFSSNTDTLFATFNLVVNKTPAENPLSVRFDPSASRISKKVDSQDILLIPTSFGFYTIGQIVVSTPTPTITPVEASTTVSPSPTLTPTPSPTATLGGTPSPTAAPVLPEAGVSFPTMLGVGLGVFALLGSLLLAF